MTPAGIATLRARLVSEEGVRLAAYYDQFGFPTQGVGHKLSDIPNAPLDQYPDIDMPTALAWLDQDIATAEQGVEAALPWASSLDPIREGVLIDMAFQMGVHGVLGFPHMLAACHSGDYVTAAAQMLASEWDVQTPSRASGLAKLMEFGQ